MKFITYSASGTTSRPGLLTDEGILPLPFDFFRETQPGMVVNALTTELTLPGNFVGMAVAAPVTSVLTLLAFAVYLFLLNWLLALVSLSIYPIVVFLIPLLQKGVNRANKKRVDASRSFSARIAEAISGIHEIQGNGACQEGENQTAAHNHL